jgi:hypothetical protein
VELVHRGLSKKDTETTSKQGHVRFGARPGYKMHQCAVFAALLVFLVALFVPVLYPYIRFQLEQGIYRG